MEAVDTGIGILPPLRFGLITAPAAPPGPSASPTAERVGRHVADTMRWVGGDTAVPGPRVRHPTLWLLAGNWVGSVRDGKRKGVADGNNTVGVQGRQKLTFQIATKPDGQPGTVRAADAKAGLAVRRSPRGETLHVFLPRFERRTGRRVRVQEASILVARAQCPTR